jgi:dephospho-CoA kinase
MGSGKDTVSEYIAKKYGYQIIDYANILREICKKEGLELTRDNLQNLRVKYGNTFLAEESVKRAKASGQGKILFTPIRRSEDILIPKKELKDVIMILVEADQKVRFQRLKGRGRENDPKDFTEFQRQEAREFSIYDFEKAFSHADYKINNNGGKKELYKQIDTVMKKIEKS